MCIVNGDVRRLVTLCSDDMKMLFVNDRFYCQLTVDRSLDVLEHYCFFSGGFKTGSFELSQYAMCYVLDTRLGNGHYASQYAKIWHHIKTVNGDVVNDFKLELLDSNETIGIDKIEIVAKPYPLDKLMDMLDKLHVPEDYKPEDGNPILSLDGVCFIDFGRYGSKSAGMEYYIDGKLYFEVVDFGGVPDGGIVRLDDFARREVCVDMVFLDDSNVQAIASIIDKKIEELMQNEDKN